MRSIYFLLFVVTTLAGCTQTQLPSAFEPGYPHAVYLIDTTRLIDGDLRYNLRVQDGDTFWLSNERLDVDALLPETTTDRVVADSFPPRVRYFIKPGDLLRVTVYELRQPGVDDIQDCTVDAQGNVHLAVIGQIKVAGQTPAQVETYLARKLEEAGRLRQATTSVAVVPVLGYGVYSIQGWPMAWQGPIEPGTYHMPTPDLRVIEAFDQPNSPALSQYKYAYLIRRLDGSPNPFSTTSVGRATERCPAALGAVAN